MEKVSSFAMTGVAVVGLDVGELVGCVVFRNKLEPLIIQQGKD